MRDTIFVLIALSLFCGSASADLLLVGERVDVEQKTEVRFDAPDRCVLTGIGFRAHQDNVTTMHVRYHRLTSEGKLTDPRTEHLGSEPDHATEVEVYLPDGWVMVGFGARGAPEWDVTTLRVWGRPLREDGTLGDIKPFNSGKEPDHGLERSILLTEEDRVLTAGGLRMAWSDISGIYARSRRIISVDDAARERLAGCSRRGWMVAGITPSFLDEVLKRVSDFDIGFLVVSFPTGTADRGIPETSEERQPLAAMAKRCADQGLDFYVWARSLDISPGAESEMAGQFLGEVLDEIPEIRGLVVGLRLQGVASEEGDEETAIEELQALADVCEKRGRELVARANIDYPEQVESVAAAARSLESAIVVVPSVVGEWDSYAPDNPLLEMFPDHKVLVEFDLGEQNSGHCLIPYARPDELQSRLVTAGLAGASGVLARVGDPNQNTFGTLNEFNLWCLDRLIDNPLQPLRPLWSDYYSERYGESASRVISAMKRTRSAVDLTYHVSRFQFLSVGSRFAGIAGAEERLEQGLEAWFPELESVNKDLENPTERVLKTAMEEKETALWLLEQSLSDVEAIQGSIPDAQYGELQRPFSLLAEVTRLWQEWARVYLLTQIYARDCSEETLGSLRAALEKLPERHQAAQAHLANGFSFGKPARVVAEVEERIRQTQEASPLAMAFKRVQDFEAEEKYEEAAEALHSLMTDERFVPYLHEHHDRLAVLSSSLHAFGGPNESIRAKRGADGIWTIEKKEGRWCWASTEGKPVIYFDAVPGPFEEPTDYVLTFEYFDEGEKKLGVDYDSAYPEGPYRPTEPIQVTNTGEWKEGRFVLDKATFKGGQNVEADLRFIQGREIMRIRNVNLAPKEE